MNSARWDWIEVVRGEVERTERKMRWTELIDDGDTAPLNIARENMRFRVVTRSWIATSWNPIPFQTHRFIIYFFLLIVLKLFYSKWTNHCWNIWWACVAANWTEAHWLGSLQQKDLLGLILHWAQHQFVSAHMFPGSPPLTLFHLILVNFLFVIIFVNKKKH